MTTAGTPTAKGKLCLWPGHGALNPYVENFATALETNGYSTEVFSPRKWLRSMSSYDALIVHWPEAAVVGNSELIQKLSHSSFVASLRQYRRRGGKVIWIFHNAAPHDRHPNDRRQSLDLSGFAKQLDGIISPSMTGLAAATELFPFLSDVPQATAHIGAYDVEQSTTQGKLEAREKLGLSPTATIAINCGTIRRYKGLEWPIRAFTEANDAERCFVIVGSGVLESYVDELRDLAGPSTSVHFRAEQVSHEEMNLYLMASDVGVFTFAKVLHSSSIVTVRSMGLPVICTRTGSLPEYASFDDGIVLVDEDEDLLAAVDKTVADWAKEPTPLPAEYDWTSISEGLNSFLDQVLD